MSYLDQFNFPSRQELADYLGGTLLANSALRLAGDTYRGDGHVPSAYFDQTTLHGFTHDAGHMLDFFMSGKQDRLKSSGFGFHYPETFLYDRYVPMPTNTRALHSEFRATAIQLALLKDVLGKIDNAADFLVDMAITLADSVNQLEDAYCIPRRRAITRHASKMSQRWDNRHANMREQGNSEAAREIFEKVSLLNKKSVETYGQDRREYALKHMVKYYLKLDKEEILEQWHEMMEWIRVNLEDREVAA